MTSPSVPDRNDAPTNGWDTVFAINFTNANSALTAGWPKVSDQARNITQDYSDPDTGLDFKLNGVFSPWQLTIGGDGKNIRMACTFASGTYTAGSKSHDLAPTGQSAMEVVIEVGMEWVPDPGQKSFVISNNTTVTTIKADLDTNKIDSNLSNVFTQNNLTLSASANARVVQQGLEWNITDGKTNFYIFYSQDKENDEFLTVYQYEQAWKNNLKILASSVSKLQPAVLIVTIANNPTSGIAADVLPQLLSLWFNENIAEFNHVFAVLDLAPQISSSEKYAWLKPTATSYAVVDQGSLDTSIFGVLTMTGQNIPGDNHEVSPYAIPTGTDANGADAGFLISGPNFVKNMLLSGAMAIFDTTDGSNFEIINDHETVQNTKELTWGKFMMDNNKQGSISDDNYDSNLDNKTIPDELTNALNNSLNIFLDSSYSVQVTSKGSQWLLTNGQEGSKEYILNKDGKNLDVYLGRVIN